MGRGKSKNIVGKEMRKAVESVLTTLLEDAYSKDEIYLKVANEYYTLSGHRIISKRSNYERRLKIFLRESTLSKYGWESYKKRSEFDYIVINNKRIPNLECWIRRI